MASVTQALLMRGAAAVAARPGWHWPLSVVPKTPIWRDRSLFSDNGWLSVRPFAASVVPKSITWQQPLSAPIPTPWALRDSSFYHAVLYPVPPAPPRLDVTWLQALSEPRLPARAFNTASAPMAWIEGIPRAEFQLSTAVDVTLAGGNLVATSTSSATNQGARLNNAIAKRTGKYYFEIKLTSLAGGGTTSVGVGTLTSTYTALGATATTGAVMQPSSLGLIWSSGSSIAGLGTRATANVIGIAIDLDNKLAWFRVAPSGNWNGIVGNDPATTTGGVTVPGGYIVPVVTFNLSSNMFTGNFGASAFTGSVPSGFMSGWTV